MIFLRCFRRVQQPSTCSPYDGVNHAHLVSTGKGSKEGCEVNRVPQPSALAAAELQDAVLGTGDRLSQYFSPFRSTVIAPCAESECEDATCSQKELDQQLFGRVSNCSTKSNVRSPRGLLTTSNLMANSHLEGHILPAGVDLASLQLLLETANASSPGHNSISVPANLNCSGLGTASSLDPKGLPRAGMGAAVGVGAPADRVNSMPELGGLTREQLVRLCPPEELTSDLEGLTVIGHGSRSVVCQALWRGARVVVKFTACPSRTPNSAAIIRQALVSKSLAHPNVLHHYSVRCCLLTPTAAAGNDLPDAACPPATGNSSSGNSACIGACKGSGVPPAMPPIPEGSAANSGAAACPNVPAMSSDPTTGGGTQAVGAVMSTPKHTVEGMAATMRGALCTSTSPLALHHLSSPATVPTDSCKDTATATTTGTDGTVPAAAAMKRENKVQVQDSTSSAQAGIVSKAAAANSSVSATAAARTSWKLPSASRGLHGMVLRENSTEHSASAGVPLLDASFFDGATSATLTAVAIKDAVPGPMEAPTATATGHVAASTAADALSGAQDSTAFAPPVCANNGQSNGITTAASAPPIPAQGAGHNSSCNAQATANGSPSVPRTSGAGCGNGADCSANATAAQQASCVGPGNGSMSFNSHEGFGNPFGGGLRHALSLQHIAALVAAREGEYLTAIIMEHGDKSTLQQAVKRGLFQANRVWSARVALRAMLRTALEVAFALQHLHSRKVVHGSLRPENVLLKGSNIDRRGFIAKVTNFSLARVCSGDTEEPVAMPAAAAPGACFAADGISNSAADGCGSEFDGIGFGNGAMSRRSDNGGCGGMSPSTCAAVLPFWSPEQFGGTVGKPSDVYAFGVVLYYIVTSTVPYTGMSPPAIIQGVAAGTLRPVWPDEAAVLPQLQELCSQCWANDPRVRPTFSQVCSSLQAMEHVLRQQLRQQGSHASGSVATESPSNSGPLALSVLRETQTAAAVVTAAAAISKPGDLE